MYVVRIWLSVEKFAYYTSMKCWGCRI